MSDRTCWTKIHCRGNMVRLKWFTPVPLFISHLLSVLAYESYRRPFYLFAHMVETIEETDAAIKEGANGMEVDVTYSLQGEPCYLYHGFPCDCFRGCFSSQEIAPYLVHVRNIGTPGSSIYNPKVSLLYLDNKLDVIVKENLTIAGEKLAQMLLEHFYGDGNSEPLVKIIIGVPTIHQKNFIVGLIKQFERFEYLLENIGFDFSNNEDLDSIEEVVRSLKLTNVWQGRGLTNCIPQTDKSLREAIHRRDSENSYIDKAYSWTIDNVRRVRNDLRVSIDGIMTNAVTRIIEVLKEPEFANEYRLATNADNPWEKIEGNGAISSKCFFDICWKDCSFKGNVCPTAVTGCTLSNVKCSIMYNCTLPCIPAFRLFFSV